MDHGFKSSAPACKSEVILIPSSITLTFDVEGQKCHPHVLPEILQNEDDAFGVWGDLRLESTKEETDTSSFVDYVHNQLETGKLTESKGHTCQWCGRTFSRTCPFKKHLKICKSINRAELARSLEGNSKEKPHECDLCDRRFVERSSLKRHLLKHKGGQRMVAEIAKTRPRVKGTSEAQESTKNTKIRAGNKSHVCEHCGKSFSRAWNLRIHLPVHTSNKRYRCQHCGTGFLQGSNLRAHLEIHSGRTPFTCELCGDQFSRLGNMERHKLVHTGEKPHVCRQCGKRFSQTATLRNHALIHNGERHHVCEQCGRGFAQPFALTRHLRIHSGVKPHLCELCGRGFSRLTLLRKHHLKHLTEKPPVAPPEEIPD